MASPVESIDHLSYHYLGNHWLLHHTLTGAAAPLVMPHLIILMLLLSLAVAIALHQLFTRPPVPERSPKAWRTYDWPVVGSALRFYSRRRDMVVEGLAASASASPSPSAHGNSSFRAFSFFVGKKHVVALGGPAGRKVFYESRGLNFSAG
jgi:hypothetical protein